MISTTYYERNLMLTQYLSHTFNYSFKKHKHKVKTAV